MNFCVSSFVLSLLLLLHSELVLVHVRVGAMLLGAIMRRRGFLLFYALVVINLANKRFSLVYF